MARDERIEQAVDDAMREPGVQVTSGSPYPVESDPDGWVRVILAVSPDGRRFHAVGGEQEPGDPKTDRAYVGRERLLKHLASLEAELGRRREREAEYRRVLKLDAMLDPLPEVPWFVEDLRVLRAENASLREKLLTATPGKSTYQ